MSEVKRYDHWVAHADSDDPESYMGESQSGDWVSHSDYAALQQKLDAVLAENAKLMSGFSFFMYSDESGFETYKTETEAIAAANEMIGCCREDAESDGWPEETETIRWGVIRQQAVECNYQKASKENGWMGWCDYKLSPETPATDAILNEVRAKALIKFAEEADRKAEAFDTSARESDDFNEDQRFRYVAAMFRGFAKQLRAGSTEGGV